MPFDAVESLFRINWTSVAPVRPFQNVDLAGNFLSSGLLYDDYAGRNKDFILQSMDTIANEMSDSSFAESEKTMTHGTCQALLEFVSCFN